MVEGQFVAPAKYTIMKKLLIALFAAALPVVATAQVQLLSGYNFGQFLGGGYPSLNGETFDPVGSIGSNFRLDDQAPGTSDGGFVGNNSTTGGYTNGYGSIYWDGSFGSSVYDFSNGVDIVATDVGINSVNGATVQGYTLAAQGDSLNLALTTNVASNRIAFVQNTLGYADFDPDSYVDGLNVTDANFTFAALASSPVTIDWYLNGSGTSFGSTMISGASMSVYAVDLPSGFYGLASAVLVGEFSGAVTMDNLQFNGVSAVPEPSTYAAILGALALGFVAIRRRRNADITA
jgi:hypothetical protein